MVKPQNHYIPFSENRKEKVERFCKFYRLLSSLLPFLGASGTIIPTTREGGGVISTVFSKLNTPTLKETCTQAIVSKIISGELKPGDRLPPERELAAMLGVSRSSVNQSVLELESMGFLSIRPRRGTVVCDYRKHPTPQSLAVLMRYDSVELDHSIFSDMMDFRLLIETECARLACANVRETTFAEMSACIDALERGDDPSDVLYQFHYLLTQASGNSVYSMFFRAFEPVIRALLRQHYSIKAEDAREAVTLHRALLEAVRVKDETNAVRLVREILLQGAAVLEKRYGECQAVRPVVSPEPDQKHGRD